MPRISRQAKEFEQFSYQRKSFFAENEELGRAYDKSILYCSIYGSKNSNMVYVPRIRERICVPCAEEDGWIKELELKEKLTITRA